MERRGQQPADGRRRHASSLYSLSQSKVETRKPATGKFQVPNFPRRCFASVPATLAALSHRSDSRMIRNPRLSGLKPLLFGTLRGLRPSPTPVPQPEQLLRRCPVSGTAKGKAKIKTGQPLKRSSIPKKKTSKPSTGGGGRGGGDDRLSRMVDSCLNAPTPLRHLTAKQREREVEREKLGLISKERQREIDAAKAAAKKGSSAEKEEPVLMGTPGYDLISLGLVDAEAVPKYELTVEDGRRLAKEYSRVLMRRHRARQAAESTLLRLKKEAIEALPEHLRAAALVPDLTPFPVNRFMATLTPPIEGYVEKVREAARASVGRQKLR
ncbi:hypothetical protein Taro_051154 [Colocasia esculenta]|uniref:Copper ion binding protein n=1 Tax=Colocasia esculenta TaxID=4460 RepID=A0A843XFS4_COLES|nr:hypothetical protein [Colocasia esculenta]